MKGPKRKKSTPQRPRLRRSFFGSDSYIEITHKLVTIGVLLYGVWLSCSPTRSLPDLQPDLHPTQEEPAEQGQLADKRISDELRLRQDLEKYQAQEPTAKRGIFLDHLLATKRRLQVDAENYQREGTPIDLRRYCLQNLHARLTLFKAPEGDSLEPQRFKALRFLESFIEEKIPAGAVDASALDGIYLYLEEQGQIFPSP